MVISLVNRMSGSSSSYAPARTLFNFHCLLPISFILLTTNNLDIDYFYLTNESQDKSQWDTLFYLTVTSKILEYLTS
jgi:hypothetical protein